VLAGEQQRRRSWRRCENEEMMWRKVVRHEWRMLRAERAVWLVVGVFAVAIGYATLNGAALLRREQQGLQRFVQAQESKTARLRQRAREMETYLAAGGSLSALPKYEKYEYDFGPLDPRYASAVNALSAALPPSPLAALTIGQSDLYPVAHTVSWWNVETVAAAEQTASPLKLSTGNFDLAFVALYIFPLFIIALSFDLLALEKERGTLGLLLSQPISLRALVIGKIALRALLVFGAALFFTSAGLALSGFDLTAPQALARLLVWVLIAALYGGFWFSLAVCVNGRGKSAASNALILVVCWLAGAVIIPTTIDLLAATLYPVPSRAEFINARREISRAVEKIDERHLREQFFKDHPEFPSDSGYSDWGRYAIANAAREEEVARRLQATRRHFDEQMAKQRALVNTLSFLSPSILAQEALYEIAGAGLSRYRHYRAQADEYNRGWKAHFWPRMFVLTTFTASDYDRMPRFTYREEQVGKAVKRVALPASALAFLTLALGWLGLRAYRRFQIAG
jgi:ABC-2 type transport system permease protein